MTGLWLNKALNAAYPTKYPVNMVTTTCKPVDVLTVLALEHPKHIFKENKNSTENLHNKHN